MTNINIVNVIYDKYRNNITNKTSNSNLYYKYNTSYTLISKHILLYLCHILL